MISKELLRTGKFLSIILRHKPEEVGLSLDKNGWLNIPDLLDAIRPHGYNINRNDLEKIVETNNKKRFVIEGDRIRANQGHSVNVDLNLKERTPPEFLFHGTSSASAYKILTEGINKFTRHHVHLSDNYETAKNVGDRRGKSCVLIIEASLMKKEGYKFYLSKNGVWLTDYVPPEFIGLFTNLY